MDKLPKPRMPAVLWLIATIVLFGILAALIVAPLVLALGGAWLMERYLAIPRLWGAAFCFATLAIMLLARIARDLGRLVSATGWSANASAGGSDTAVSDDGDDDGDDDDKGEHEAGGSGDDRATRDHGLRSRHWTTHRRR